MELQKSDVIESASSQVWHWEVTGSPILWIYGRLEGDILTQKGVLGSVLDNRVCASTSADVQVRLIFLLQKVCFSEF